MTLVSGAGLSGSGWSNGKATAVLFAREGAKVLAADINLDVPLETKRIIEADGGICEEGGWKRVACRRRRCHRRCLHREVRINAPQTAKGFTCATIGASCALVGLEGELSDDLSCRRRQIGSYEQFINRNDSNARRSFHQGTHRSTIWVFRGQGAR
jgi:hypothetical protein